MPGIKATSDIATNNHRELGIGLLAAESIERDKGVAGATQLDFNRRRHKIACSFDRSFNHCQTNTRFGDGSTSKLLPRLVVHHQPHLIKTELIPDLIGNNQVPDMRWVEGSA